MMDHNGVKYYRFKEAATVMGVSESFLYQQKKEEHISCIQKGSVIWISSEHIADFFKKFEVKAKTTYRVKEKADAS